MTEGIDEVESNPECPTDSQGIVEHCSNNDTRRVVLIQQQLILLLHALDCLIKDQRELENHLAPCAKPFCTILKTVLVHMNTCTAGKFKSS